MYICIYIYIQVLGMQFQRIEVGQVQTQEQLGDGAVTDPLAQIKSSTGTRICIYSGTGVCVYIYTYIYIYIYYIYYIYVYIIYFFSRKYILVQVYIYIILYNMGYRYVCIYVSM
jgi:hypothetical protein